MQRIVCRPGDVRTGAASSLSLTPTRLARPARRLENHLDRVPGLGHHPEASAARSNGSRWVISVATSILPSAIASRAVRMLVVGPASAELPP
jgi:hypothetical protein